MPSLRPAGNRLAFIFGLLCLLIPVAFAIFVPWLSDRSFDGQSLSQILTPPSSEAGGYWLGSDHYGRDMAIRLAYALRLSLTIAFITTLVASAVGTFLAIWCTHAGGWLDRVASVIIDLTLAMPGLLLVLLLVAIAPEHLWPLYFGVSIILSIEFFRVVRAKSLTIRTSNAVKSSHLLGFSTLYLLRRHYLPEVLPLVLRLMAFSMASAILSVAALGFINVGVKPPRAELGLMMIELLPYYDEAPWALLQPVAALFLVVLGLNLLASGTREDLT